MRFSVVEVSSRERDMLKALFDAHVYWADRLYVSPREHAYNTHVAIQKSHNSS